MWFSVLRFTINFGENKKSSSMGELYSWLARCKRLKLSVGIAEFLGQGLGLLKFG